MYQIYEKMRDARGVTDYQVAKATGVTSASLSNWKNGRYAPKVDKLQKLANYFGVSVTVFLENEHD